MAFLGVFLDPNCPKYCLILLKFAPEVVFKARKTVFQKFLKNSNFYENLTPFYSMKEAKIEKTKQFLETKFSHWAIQYCKNQGPILSQFFRKNMITFCSILAIFCPKKGHSHMLKGQNQNMTYTIAISQFLGMFLCKKFCSSTSQFCGYNNQKSLF